MTEQPLTVIVVCAALAVLLHAFLLGAETDRGHLGRLLVEPGPLLRFLLVTFGFMPALTLALAWFTPVPWPVWAGLALISLTPPGWGAAQKLLGLERDTRTGLAWQTLAMLLSVFTIPLTLIVMEKSLGRGFGLEIDEVFRKVLVLFLLPLSGGMLLRHLALNAAIAVERWIGPIAAAAQILALLVVWVVAAPAFSSMTPIWLPFIIGFVAIEIIAGHQGGGPGRENRPALAVSLTMRWVAPALVLTGGNDISRTVAPVLVIYTLVSFVSVEIYAQWIRIHRVPLVKTLETRR